MTQAVVVNSDQSCLTELAIEARGITKSFLGTRALDEVDFAVARGEVHGLVGKNGAGKSTLVKILSGAYSADAGEICVGSQTFRTLNPMLCRAAGIAVVHQNTELHPELSVAANIFLGAEPRGRFGFIDEATLRRRSEELLAQLGLSLPVSKRLGDLDIALRQQVAIAKAVREKAQVLLLDEPTAALNKSQTDFLFGLIRDLARQGLAIVYISHHLDEVLAISDRITVLRNGKKVHVVQRGSVNKDNLISMIVGHSIEAYDAHRELQPSEKTILTLRSVSSPGKLDDVSFSLRKGEIIGLTGLVGGGAQALAAVIGGVERAHGDIMLDGAPYAPKTIREAIARGVLFIPEDMRARGLVMQLSIANNITLAALSKLAHLSWLDSKAELAAARAMSERLDLHPRAPEREVRFLSGGNQRKALLGRAIFANARLFVLEEPTQGVDVEAQRQVHEHLRGLASAGTSIVFVSTDLEELIALSDRILVLRDGKIARSLMPSGLTSEALLSIIQAQSTDDGAHV